jgi:hypothetical protein
LAFGAALARLAGALPAAGAGISAVTLGIAITPEQARHFTRLPAMAGVTRYDFLHCGH